MATATRVSQVEYKTALKEFKAATERFETVLENLEPEPVDDLEVTDWSGNTVSLSDLFGDKNDLIVVHNMGASCSYCTLWADGFKGLLPHLEDRAAFVLVTPDNIDAQKKFAASRDWPFRMYSSEGHPFVKELGFASDTGGTHPGFSAFHKNDDGSIVRTGWDHYGPSDRYCALWPMFSGLLGGPGEWSPKFRYEN